MITTLSMTTGKAKRLIMATVLCMLSISQVWAYDFSAVSPSGHTLYYEIISGTTNVGVVRPGTSKTYNNYVSGNVVIPATVSYNDTIYNVTELRSIADKRYSYGAFYNCPGLTSVTIPTSVTAIGDRAFCMCTGLTSITIPNSVTAIGVCAFQNCTGLTSITIPNSVTYIEVGSFSGCTGLTSVTIPNSVTTIEGLAFQNCTGLTSLTIPKSVTIIRYRAFCSVKNIIYNGTASGSPWGALHVNCYVEGDFMYSDSTKNILIAYIGNSSNVTIPNWVTTIGGYAFENCTGLTSVSIPKSVTSIGDYAFSGCTSLNSFTIPASVQYIGISAFYNTPYYNNASNWVDGTLYKDNCLLGVESSLSGSYSIQRNTRIIAGGAFTYCIGLTSVTIPKSVTSIGDYAFYGCTGLTSVTIPKSVTSIGGYAFYNCTGLTSVTISKSVDSIGGFAFYNCIGLTSITIPNSVTSIGESAFDKCTNLSSVVIPTSVTSIGCHAFYLIKNIIYSGTASGNPWGAFAVNGYIDGDFIYSDNTKKTLEAYIGTATNVTILNSVSSINENAFYDCTDLTSVTIPNSVTSIGDRAFYNCTGLTSITIPNSVTSIKSHAFQNCTGLTSVTIPNSVTTIGESAFSNCTGLTSINIPNSVTNIEYCAFYLVKNIIYNGTATGSPWRALHVNCYVEGDFMYSDSTKNILVSYIGNSSNITIPNSVTTIGQYAFYDCTGLTSITIPKSVNSIGAKAFNNCTSLGRIDLKSATPPTINSNSFQNVSSAIPVYIPHSSLSNYSNSDWGTIFSNLQEN